MKGSHYLPQSCFESSENYFLILTAFYYARLIPCRRRRLFFDRRLFSCLLTNLYLKELAFFVQHAESLGEVGDLFIPIRFEGWINQFGYWILNARFVSYPDIGIGYPCSASDQLGVIGGRYEYARYGDFRICKRGKTALISVDRLGLYDFFKLPLPTSPLHSEIRLLEDRIDAFVDTSILQSPEIVETRYEKGGAVVVERYSGGSSGGVFS